MTFERTIKEYQKKIDRVIATLMQGVSSRSLRTPISHVVDAGGKRIRPLITMLACESAGGNANDALNAAVAVELLHTFTLVHDDIMDNAALRRGLQTVHTKWDANVAILAGDTIAALAMQALADTRSPRLGLIEQFFAEAFVEVCDGQAMDKDLEAGTTADRKKYFTMIEKKTAAMVSMSAAVGGCIGSGDPQRINALARFGKLIGVAFQIRDDALDITADKKKFGKEMGSDIREGKKTYLLVTAATAARKAEHKVLIKKYISQKGLQGSDVNKMAAVYRDSGALALAEQEIHTITADALEAVDTLPASEA
ncbi:MAG TPA: polyprenyl synthetase family protein, partial [Candidatus Kapabacteria bacterium]|nr:polyprenyl synthetase family protein [Candidatus Kapabacteria bacterium]